MACIKVSDMAYGRLKAPDLDLMEEFLTRFGMVRSERTATALYMRGADSPHHIHVTEKGEPKFVGFAYYAPIATKRQKLNTGEDPLLRAGELMRLPKGPSHVKRIGHGVMMTPKFRETVDWFREMLGFVCSDDVYAGEKNNLIGSFNRCDRGDTYVDHHVFFCLNHAKTGLNHLSFEVPDIDDVAMGHDYLAQLGKYEHMWGIGRHVLGR